MQLYLIRHAQSENNARWSQTGAKNGYIPDPLLTDKGHRQAAILAKHLAHQSGSDDLPRKDPFNRRGFPINFLYTSLMQRAIQTAEYISRAINLPLYGRQDIFERGGLVKENPDTGDPIGIAGPGRKYFAASYPGLILPTAVDDDGWWNRPRESYEEAQDRARQFLDNIKRQHGNQSDGIAIVSHGGFINNILKEQLGSANVDQDSDMLYGTWFRVSNTSITKFEFEPGLVLLSYHNRIDHLPSDLIT